MCNTLTHLLFFLFISLLLFLPLLAVILGLGLGPSGGFPGVVMLIAASLGFGILFAVGLWAEAIAGSPLSQSSPWMSLDAASTVSFGQLLDPLSAGLLACVLGAGSAVLLFAVEYMWHDPQRAIFILRVAFFIACMALLATARDLTLLFLGWEGIGLASFLLIGFWCGRVQAVKAALKAVAVNRVGDLGLVFLLVGWLGALGDLDGRAPAFLDGLMVLGLVMGVAGKSAQLGLHTWLPDAMEGPTPVSALIHAATLVTAGVFLTLRLSAGFWVSGSNAVMLAWWALAGAILAGLVACVQWDLKKSIAFSTCSQLAWMLVACGHGYGGDGMLHLLTHAAFKALLFMAAGVVIHAIGGSQDLRRMGGLAGACPVGLVWGTIGSWALIGGMGGAGAVSKDRMLLGIGEAAMGWWGLGMILLAGVTVVYGTRSWVRTFVGGTGGVYSAVAGADGTALMVFGLAGLGVAAGVCGMLLQHMWGSGPGLVAHDPVDLELSVGGPLIGVLFLVLVAGVVAVFAVANVGWSGGSAWGAGVRGASRVLQGRGLWDVVYGWGCLVMARLVWASHCWWDRGWVEWAVAWGPTHGVTSTAGWVRRLGYTWGSVLLIGVVGVLVMVLIAAG